MLAIGADQNAASNFNSAVGTATAYAVQHANDQGSNASNEVNYLGALEGFLTTAEQHGNIAAAQKLDGSNAAKNAWANLVFSVASATPIPGSSALEVAFQLTNSAGSASIVQIWPTNKLAGAQSDAQLNTFAGKSALDVPIAQGLIDGDPKLKQAVESGNYAWYQNGKVVPDASSMDDFVTWFDGQVQPFSQVAQNGYTGSSTTYFIP